MLLVEICSYHPHLTVEAPFQTHMSPLTIRYERSTAEVEISHLYSSIWLEVLVCQARTAIEATQAILVLAVFMEH